MNSIIKVFQSQNSYRFIRSVNKNKSLFRNHCRLYTSTTTILNGSTTNQDKSTTTNETILNKSNLNLQTDNNIVLDIEYYFKRKDFKGLHKNLQSFLEFGQIIKAKTFHLIINRLKNEKEYTSAFQFFDLYLQTYPTQKESIITKTIELDLYARTDINKAKELLDKMIEQDVFETLNDKEIAYTIMLNENLKLTNMDQAFQWFERIQNEVKPSDVTSFNYMINCFAKAGQFNIVDSLLAQMKEKGIQADKFTFTTIIASLQFVKDISSAVYEKYFNMLFDNDSIEFDKRLLDATFDTMIRFNQYDKAIRLFEKYHLSMFSSKLLYDMFKCYQISPPEDINKIHRLWDHYLVNGGTKNKYLIKYFAALTSYHTHIQTIDVPSIFKTVMQDAAEKGFELVDFDINIINLLISSYSVTNQATEAWTLFQMALERKAANHLTFFGILHLLLTCDTSYFSVITTNNCKEILTSSYYLNETLEKTKEAHDFLWRPVFEKLILANRYSDIWTTIEIMTKFSSQDLNDYQDILSPYLRIRAPNENLFEKLLLLQKQNRNN
ncbi:hypothetical protein CYY_002418 [Polysphondylium violaceum]|uniref:Pentacotripeptide-repeat region of PRORP domain-containing protein n=1 Tax=Polysphondylium violaceum TaxID=133409 RepID=A0A8J4V2X4_9MYCE|nr:hypothetical protein CYY_002418 [Polysphondylium violaceum]